MGWYYRAPQSFPALYAETLRNAAISPEQPMLLFADKNHHLATVAAEKFRWFKWCIRKHQVPGDLFNILEHFDVRSRIHLDGVGSLLYVTARSTKISEFVRLNPELAAEIVPNCQ